MWLAARMHGQPPPLLVAIAVAPVFLRWRAPWLLLWAAYFSLYVAVLIAGRWSRDTRPIHPALNLGWLVLLIWGLAAGRVFQAEGAEGVARLSLLIIVLVVIIDLVTTLRRTVAPLRQSAVWSPMHIRTLPTLGGRADSCQRCARAC